MNAQHHSVYIPNYLQAFDNPNLNESPSSYRQQEQSNDRFYNGFDPLQFDVFQTITTTTMMTTIKTTVPTIQVSFDTSTNHIDIVTNISTKSLTATTSTFLNLTSTTKLISTTLNSVLIAREQTTSIQNSTHSSPSIDIISFNNETLPRDEIILSSTLNNALSSTLTYSTENELMPTYQQISETTRNIFSSSSTIRTFLKNNSDVIINQLNRTYPQSKNLINNKQYNIYNTTDKEMNRYLTDRKSMQSLIHLLPANLWSQLQSNFSTVQSQYVRPSSTDDVVLAAAAAQAGLRNRPGPHPIPDHLWHKNPNYYRNPAQINNNIPIKNPTTTCELILV